MKIVIQIASQLVVVSVAVLCASANAQFVKGNEAVRVTAQGRTVETPPVPPSVGKPCAVSALCHAGAWHMVETASGLLECTEPYARPTTCRSSTYGSQKLPRLWIVKTHSTWRWCQFPDLAGKCPEIFARSPANLPFDAIQ